MASGGDVKGERAEIVAVKDGGGMRRMEWFVTWIQMESVPERHSARRAHRIFLSFVHPSCVLFETRPDSFQNSALISFSSFQRISPDLTRSSEFKKASHQHRFSNDGDIIVPDNLRRAMLIVLSCPQY